MGKVKIGKKFGHKVGAPGPLGQQISSERVAKPSQRVKGRHVRQQNKEAKKRGMDDISKILKQQSVMNQDDNEEFDILDVDDVIAPVNTTKLCKDFEKEMKLDLSEEERAFAALMPSAAADNSGVSHMARLRQGLQQATADARAELQSNIGTVNNSALQSHLSAAGEVLASITSRREKVPRIVADLPNHKNWLKKLYYTNPEKWSAAAVFKVTKAFMAGGYAVTEVFAQKVLLPRCRDDIAFYKRLNQHLYMALRWVLKCRPAAFFGGVVQSLCQAGDCSLREAIVFSSVLVRHSAPSVLASAALETLCQLPYSGANSIFLRVLLNKKYMLQYGVIDAAVAHFLSFKQETRDLPTLWHQSLLTLAQRYKSCLTQQQKEGLKSLAAHHSHRLITREVHLQLDNSPCRPQWKPPKPAAGGLVL